MVYKKKEQPAKRAKRHVKGIVPEVEPVVVPEVVSAPEVETTPVSVVETTSVTVVETISTPVAKPQSGVWVKATVEEVQEAEKQGHEVT